MDTRRMLLEGWINQEDYELLLSLFCCELYSTVLNGWWKMTMMEDLRFPLQSNIQQYKLLSTFPHLSYLEPCIIYHSHIPPVHPPPQPPLQIIYFSTSHPQPSNHIHPTKAYCIPHYYQQFTQGNHPPSFLTVSSFSSSIPQHPNGVNISSLLVLWNDINNLWAPFITLRMKIIKNCIYH